MDRDTVWEKLRRDHGEYLTTTLEPSELAYPFLGAGLISTHINEEILNNVVPRRTRNHALLGALVRNRESDFTVFLDLLYSYHHRGVVERISPGYRPSSPRHSTHAEPEEAEERRQKAAEERRQKAAEERRQKAAEERRQKAAEEAPEGSGGEAPEGSGGEAPEGSGGEAPEGSGASGEREGGGEEGASGGRKEGGGGAAPEASEAREEASGGASGAREGGGGTAPEASGAREGATGGGGAKEAVLAKVEDTVHFTQLAQMKTFGVRVLLD